MSSGNLVSTFHSVWSKEQLEAHRVSAETVRAVAMDAFTRAAEHARLSKPLLEGQLGGWIRDELAARGLLVDADAHVAIGPNAADPHYDPRDAGDAVTEGEVLLNRSVGKTDRRGSLRRPDLDGHPLRRGAGPASDHLGGGSGGA